MNNNFRKTVEIRDSISIDASAEDVFALVSDANNDPLWRTEVDRMDVDGAPEIGTLATEYSTFYHRLHTVTPTEIVELTPPTRVVLETPETNSTWLRSIRSVEPVAGAKSLFTYELAFDLDAMKQISPIVPPPALIRIWYKQRVRRYLGNAKGLIETRSRR